MQKLSSTLVAVSSARVDSNVVDRHLSSARASSVGQNPSVAEDVACWQLASPVYLFADGAATNVAVEEERS